MLAVQGKGKSRKLVAVPSVGKYLDRIRACAREAARKRAEAAGKKNVPDHAIEPRPDDLVFTTIDGTPASSLHKHLIDDLLTKAGLREGPGGTVRSTYSFRHTYAPTGSPSSRRLAVLTRSRVRPRLPGGIKSHCLTHRWRSPVRQWPSRHGK